MTEFKVGETVGVTFMDASPLPWAGVTANTAAWLRRVSETKFTAFSVNCAHLGCPVRWLPDAQAVHVPLPRRRLLRRRHGRRRTAAARLSRYPSRVNGEVVEIHTEPIPID